MSDSKPQGVPTEDTPTQKACIGCSLAPVHVPTCPMYPQDDRQLRERIRAIIVDITRDYDTGTLDDVTDIYVDRLIATAQLQLVTELEARVSPKMTLSQDAHDPAGDIWAKGYNAAIDEIVSVLEHKKQELERGK